jgi:hypothetical protein
MRVMFTSVEVSHQFNDEVFHNPKQHQPRKWCSFLRFTAVINNMESWHATSALAFQAISKNFEKRLLDSSCVSTCLPA